MIRLDMPAFDVHDGHMTTTYTDDNGTIHVTRCWTSAMILVVENAIDSGIVNVYDHESCEIAEWDTTVGSLTATWLSDGTATCRCNPDA